jgi:hypothetical protein
LYTRAELPDDLGLLVGYSVQLMATTGYALTATSASPEKTGGYD